MSKSNKNLENIWGGGWCAGSFLFHIILLEVHYLKTQVEVLSCSAVKLLPSI